MAQKSCAKCKKIFEPKVFFGRDYSYCKNCISTKRKEQWKNNKERIKASNKNSILKKLYGINIEEYNLLLNSQFGECAICRSKSGNRKRKYSLCVDHCHKTGKVRGLLCQPCNTAIGMFNDEIILLKRAIKYLKGN